MTHVITRHIGIDAGHRIMTHGSKCRHIHGHRYEIEATCCDVDNVLHQEGDQTDMVLDFGFLKEEMMRHIDDPCDHGFITSSSDTEVLTMFAPNGSDLDEWIAGVQDEVEKVGHYCTEATKLDSKLYVLKAQPTAECLARHWFMRLKQSVIDRSGGLATLVKIRVWETPNCWAEYSE